MDSRGCAPPQTSLGVLGGAFYEICCQIAGKVLQKQQKWVNFRLRRALHLDLCAEFIKVGASRVGR